ncbi:hypothetical protein [Chitinophaga barathri]|uniref:Anti-sigma factor n=1 Tax=Chitinophaga barathri TaxID=1647451 RepID=A0A3N4MPN7_9BACT|nr:hypothetical protein [Chitinophaga barathri]RPD41629.1 hypothetical protein EG028_09995 [Chitinophaga barathri]
MKLEDFIQQNRSAFEEEGPGPKVWAALEKELPVKQKTRVITMMARHWWKAAILVALVANAGILLTFLQTKKEVAVVIPEMQEMEQFYTTRIEQKLDELKQIPAAELGLDSTTRNELELRNETYRMLEKELAGNPGNERIRSAMIRYYQMKLELLDKILDEHNKYNNDANTNSTPLNKKDVL